MKFVDDDGEFPPKIALPRGCTLCYRGALTTSPVNLARKFFLRSRGCTYTQYTPWLRLWVKGQQQTTCSWIDVKQLAFIQ